MSSQLTPEQSALLAADIDANPTLSALMAEGNYAAVADYYNTEATPAFVAWKTSVQTDEVGVAVNYVAVEALTDANRTRINTFYVMNPVSFDPSRADIRSYWANTFSGALGGQGEATRTSLENLWRMNASNAEKLFSLGPGTGTYAQPATLTFQGDITTQDLEEL